MGSQDPTEGIKEGEEKEEEEEEEKEEEENFCFQVQWRSKERDGLVEWLRHGGFTMGGRRDMIDYHFDRGDGRKMKSERRKKNKKREKKTRRFIRQRRQR